MRSERGEVTHVLSIGEDITEQRQAERSMALSEKLAAVGRLAAGVAHEVSTPLATIATCATALIERLEEGSLGDDAPPEFREYLDLIEGEAFRAKKITGDLLDFSRVSPSEKAKTSLGAIVERTLSILKHHPGLESVGVETRIPADLPDIHVEDDAILQALVVLIVNALDAMPDGGTLSISAREAAGEVRCEVRDTGCGIAPADVPKIFEPFFTTKPPGRGTGLGLAVCHGIVRSHGGRMEVDSSPGDGSRFTVILPIGERKDAEDDAVRGPLELPGCRAATAGRGGG
jgi:signal transduction histidine kinase